MGACIRVHLRMLTQPFHTTQTRARMQPVCHTYITGSDLFRSQNSMGRSTEDSAHHGNKGNEFFSGCGLVRVRRLTLSIRDTYGDTDFLGLTNVQVLCVCV